MSYLKTYSKYKLKGFLAKFIPDVFFKKIPDSILIEPTNICNLSCPVCPTTFGMNRVNGFLNFDLFKSIIDELKPYKKKPQIEFAFAGEPMLHKGIYSFIEYAVENHHKVYISTNVTAINENNARKLIQSGLSSIHLCIDGFSNKSHDTYRIGSDFKIIKQNIETFLRVKSELRSKMPFVQIQTLLTSLSVPEKNEMIDWAKKIGANSIYFKSLSIKLGHSDKVEEHTIKDIKKKWSYLVPEEDEFKRKKYTLNKPYCSIPINQSVIYWNGDLGLCCCDYDNSIMNFNIKKNGYLNTLFSKEVIKFRKQGFQKKHSICNGCDLGNADNMGFQAFKKRDN